MRPNHNNPGFGNPGAYTSDDLENWGYINRAEISVILFWLSTSFDVQVDVSGTLEKELTAGFAPMPTSGPASWTESGTRL